MEDWIYANTYEKNEPLIKKMHENVEYAVRRLESHIEHNYPFNYVDQLAIEIIRKNNKKYENEEGITKYGFALEYTEKSSSDRFIEFFKSDIAFARCCFDEKVKSEKYSSVLLYGREQVDIENNVYKIREMFTYKNK